MSRNVTVKLSPYEQAINRLNDLPLKLDRIFSDALEDLRRQRDEARAEVERLRADKDRLHGILRDIEYDKDKVAEAQREACAMTIERYVGEQLMRQGLSGYVRATPLVTEGEP